MDGNWQERWAVAESRIRIGLQDMDATLHLEIEERIRQILITELGIKPGLLDETSSTSPLLGRGIGLDSIDALSLVAALEKEFDIQIDDGDFTVDLFRNIATVAEYLFHKTSRQENHSV